MTGGDGKTPNSEAMSDILASIRRIVADESGAAGLAGGAGDTVFELTPEMRLDGGGASTASTKQATAAPAAQASKTAAPASPTKPPEAKTAAPPSRPASEPATDSPAAPGIPDPKTAPPDLDEAAVADIVRTVLRQEFAGDFGRSLTQQLTTLVRREIARHEEARKKTDQGS